MAPTNGERSDTSEPPEAGTQPKRLKITAWNGWEVLQKCDATKTAKKWTRPRASGKLARLPSLPLDILFEIFGHLPPLDVLHLARTTKALRRILMHRSSVGIWRAALRTVEGLPDCPSDMSEPAYVNLVFDTHCHECLRKNVRNPDYRLRVRYCSGCARRCLENIEDVEMEEVFFDCLVLSDWNCTYDEDIMYHKASAERIRKEYYALPEDKRAEYVERRQSEVIKITEHAELCDDWEADVFEKRLAENDLIRADRKRAIIERLTALGWGEEIEKLPTRYDNRYPNVIPLKDHPKVREAKPLTARVWQNIKDTMIEYMEQMKEHRLRVQQATYVRENKEQAMKMYRIWRETLPASELELGIPSVLDFCHFKPIRDLWEDTNEVKEDIEFWAQIADRGRMTKFVEDWRNKAKDELLPKLMGGIPFRCTQAQLELAVAVFRCTEVPHVHFKKQYHCNMAAKGSGWPKEDEQDRIWYPQMLHHKCNTVTGVGLRELPAVKDDPLLVLGDGEYGYTCGAKRQTWSCKKLVFDEKASKVVVNILVACGMDPRTTTVAELDKEDPRLVCLKCTYGHRCDGERRVQVRCWRNMVAHCLKKHWGDLRIQYERLTDEDVKKAKDIEAGYYSKPISPYEKMNPVWQCDFCRDTTQETDRCTLQDIKQHMKTSHSLSYPVQDLHYCRALDAPPDEPTTISMVPGPSTVVPFPMTIEQWDRLPYESGLLP
ncbi:hypothetical protein GLOTRDRAFT_139079 [Gloeophyllum trabeum ATCC 11539]|uniref:F-box domain-containing protein n=1 Tax=Gloeophyllum trabeum (strain ATCC 11539 / FP-39264 / Madison 617) TaxID=670483 RepID=S7Q3F1_GLOTA|nr:uncharacterized protein GLOTRDRAFT_139079 [Gloeophyllum trabeum ATCC 11539]EPQ54501.1 hypothetical protein GLOTRDRAFT_139079 [Gloeophyllum trabeum ATCC 11539]